MERIHLESSFDEVDMFVRLRGSEFGIDKLKFPGDGVITGTVKISSRPVAIFGRDFTVFGGSLTEIHAEKIVKTMSITLKSGIPVIGLDDSGGARIYPNVVKTVTHEDVGFEELSGAGTHAQKSGVAHFVYNNEIETLLNVKKILSYLPVSFMDKPPEYPYTQSFPG